MQIKTYDETDLQEYTYSNEFRHQFIADVVGDNADLFDDVVMDNNELGHKLKELGAIGSNDSLDTESCCFYIYFKTKRDGVSFLKKLTAYLTQKLKLIKEAKEF